MSVLIEPIRTTGSWSSMGRKLEGSHSIFYCYFDHYWRKISKYVQIMSVLFANELTRWQKSLMVKYASRRHTKHQYGGPLMGGMYRPPLRSPWWGAQQTHNVNTTLYNVVILQRCGNYIPATLLQRKLQRCATTSTQRCEITL